MANVLAKLRQQVIAGRKIGCICPVCNQHAKEYARSVNKNMVVVLGHMHRWYQVNDPSLTKWLQVMDHMDSLPERYARACRDDYPKMAYFGLIEKRPNTDHKVVNMGYYRLTQKGIDFLLNKIKIPKYVIRYNKVTIRESNETIDVYWSLRKANFSWTEMMQNTGNII